MWTVDFSALWVTEAKGATMDESLRRAMAVSKEESPVDEVEVVVDEEEVASGIRKEAEQEKVVVKKKRNIQHKLQNKSFLYLFYLLPTGN